jgi:hypothetical protein
MTIKEESDVISDYYSTNFYYHLEVGKWNKPFKLKGAKNENDNNRKNL